MIKELATYIAKCDYCGKSQTYEHPKSLLNPTTLPLPPGWDTIVIGRMARDRCIVCVAMNKGKTP
jgi:hypothetical protein